MWTTSPSGDHPPLGVKELITDRWLEEKEKCVVQCNEQFQKYPFPSEGRLLEFLWGKGVSKIKIFKGGYEAKLEFLKELGGGGEGLNQPSL